MMVSAFSHEGTRGVIEGLAHDAQFLLDEQAGVGGQIGRDADGGGVGAVHGAEGVRHVDFRHVGKGLGESGIVLGLALGEAEVLQQEDLAGLQRGGLGLGVLTDGIGGKDHFLSQQLAQTLGNGRQRQLLEGFLPLLAGNVGLVLALFDLLFHIAVEGGHGLAQVGAGNDGSALIEQIPEGGQRGDDALVAGDLAGLFVLRNVEVAADKHLLALDVNIIDGFLVVVHAVSSL